MTFLSIGTNCLSIGARNKGKTRARPPLATWALLSLPLSTLPLSSLGAERLAGDIGVAHVMLGQFQPDTETFSTLDTQSNRLAAEEFPGDTTNAAITVQIALLSSSIIDVGWETGSFAGWRDENTRFSVSGGEAGTLATFVPVENELSTLDLFMGLYVSTSWSDHVRLYVGAGPLVSLGYIDIKDTLADPVTGDRVVSDGNASVSFKDDNEFATGGGYYGRAGIDFYSSDGFGLGLGVRYIDTEMDFEDTLGEVTFKGPQYLLSITKKF